MFPLLDAVALACIGVQITHIFLLDYAEHISEKFAQPCFPPPSFFFSSFLYLLTATYTSKSFYRVKKASIQLNAYSVQFTHICFLRYTYSWLPAQFLAMEKNIYMPWT